MISAVLLQWKRQARMREAYHGIARSPLVSETILWNNDPTVKITGNRDVTVINSSRNFSCWTRYAVALLAKNDTLLFVDDDLALTVRNIELLYAAHRAHANQVVGPFARNLQPSGALYDEQGGGIGVPNEGPADIILGRVSMFHRSLLLRALPHMQPPYTIDDDVAFCLAATKATGLRHFAAAIGAVEDIDSTDDHSSFKQPGFKETRNQTALNIRLR